MSRPTHGKQDRERSKKMKAEAKRERRRSAAVMKAEPAEEDAPAPLDEAETASVLQMLDELHSRHANNEINDEDFEAAKSDLLNRLVVD